MSTRFKRNDSNVPDDRLFPSDFIVDQNGQDADILQLAKDFGCLPCIGSGLAVSEENRTTSQVKVTLGWAYDINGRRITVESDQIKTITPGSAVTNFIVIEHLSAESDNRPAHRTGVSYPTRIADSYLLSVTTTAPADPKITLAECTQVAAGDPISVTTVFRPASTCKLIAQSMIPEVLAAPPSTTPPGQQNELPDLPKGRTIPMPIILSGTRNGSSWSGIETVMPEELGRTTSALSALTLERVNLKSGTALADVKVWIGDWGDGQRSGTTGEENRCVFSMPTMSGVTAWDDHLWIKDPLGARKYYLVKHDESWSSLITDSGSNWVECVDNIPEGTAAEYYICPYAEKYRAQSFPYQQILESESVAFTHPYTVRSYNRIASPVAPVVLIKDLNLGGKYLIKVASEITGDNYTKWAEIDFIVGSDLIFCWQAETSYLTTTPVDGGVEVAIPQPTGTKTPEAYELCYTYGKDPATVADPSFDNPAHPTVRTSEQLVKLDIPPGSVVKVSARALRHRIVMRCAGLNKTLTPDYATLGNIFAGGVSLRRNRKAFTNPVNESVVATNSSRLADQQKLANPIWVESIALFNPTDAAKTNFEVYVHGSNQAATSGRKIQIGGSGNDASEVGARGWVQKEISDFRITDQAMAVTIKNTHTASQDFDLRYTVQYREDSDASI